MSKNVLIAEDTEYMRAQLRKILEELGMVVVAEATDGESTITMFREHKPDLIILNLVMPKGNGMNLLKLMRLEDPQSRILVCSALGQAPTIFEAIRSGALDYIVKPFNKKRLTEAINRALSLNLAS